MQPPIWSSVTPHFCKMRRLDGMASKGPSRRDSPLIKIAPPHPLSCVPAELPTRKSGMHFLPLGFGHGHVT